jgi:hypothetical protein
MSLLAARTRAPLFSAAFSLLILMARSITLGSAPHAVAKLATAEADDKPGGKRERPSSKAAKLS